MESRGGAGGEGSLIQRSKKDLSSMPQHYLPIQPLDHPAHEPPKPSVMHVFHKRTQVLLYARLYRSAGDRRVRPHLFPHTPPMVTCLFSPFLGS